MSQGKRAAPQGGEGFAWKDKHAITKASENVNSVSYRLAQAPSISVPAAFEVLIYVPSPKQLRSARGKEYSGVPVSGVV